jgi:HEAT repeat protein
MKSSRGLTLTQGGLLALVLAGLAYWAWDRYHRPSAPTYEGQTLAQWATELSDPEYAVSDRAADALVHAGADAVPTLLEACASKDIRLHRRAAAGLVRTGAPAAPELVAALWNGPNDRVETGLVRMGPDAVPALIDALKEEKVGPEAARVLGLIGPRAADAVPPLIEVLRQKGGGAKLRAEAAGALGRIGVPAEEVAPVLIAALQDNNAGVREQTAHSLIWMGPPGRAAVPALIADLKDDEPKVASAACLALAQIGDAGAVPALLETFQGKRARVAEAAGFALRQLRPNAKVVVSAILPLAKGASPQADRARVLLASLGPTSVPALTDALRDNDPAVRQAAAEVLGLLGPVARESVPALTGVLKDKTPATALAAALSLAWIDPTRTDAVPLLADALDNPAATEALGAIGPGARTAVPALIAALKPRKGGENNDLLRAGARYALARIGPPAVRELIAALKDNNEGVASAAAEALGWILPPQKAAVGPLREAMKRDKAQAGAFALALGQLGPVARDAVADLTALLADADARPQAAVALVRIDPEQVAKVVPLLIEDLKGQEPKRRQGAVTALANLGGAAQPAAAALAQRIKDPELTGAVQMALRGMGTGAMPVLGGLLKDPNPELRRFAFDALARIGPAARDAVTPLLGALRDPDPRTRSAAAQILEGIGPDARAAIPYLIESLMDPHGEVRATAASALGHFGPDAKEARLPLRECLLDPDKDVRYAAALALGRIDPTYVEAVPNLRDTLHDAYPGPRLAAIDSLARIEPARIKDTVPILIALSQAPDYLTRFKAVEGLVELAPEEAKTAVPMLDGALNDVDPDVRHRAARLLERIERPKNDQEKTPEYQRVLRRIVLALAASLRDRDPAARAAIAHALGELGAKAREASPMLVILLHDGEPAVRKEAAGSLRSIDPQTAKRFGID